MKNNVCVFFSENETFQNFKMSGIETHFVRVRDIFAFVRNDPKCNQPMCGHFHSFCAQCAPTIFSNKYNHPQSRTSGKVHCIAISSVWGGGGAAAFHDCNSSKMPP